MDIFLKTSAGILIVLVLGAVLSKQTKELSVILLIFACAAIVTAALSFLDPVIRFLEKLEEIGQLNGQFVRILLKTTGVSVLAEVLALLCSDGGNAALGKAVHILAGCVILWMSVPLFTKLLELIETVLQMI